MTLRGGYGRPIIGFLAVALAVTALVARHLEITTHAALFLALGSPAMMVGLPLAAVWYLLRRRWAVAALAAGLTGALAIAVLPRTAEPVAGVALSVMSANLLQGRADPATVVELALDGVDLLAVQELTPDALNQLSARGIDSALPHRIVKPLRGGSGAGLWSRYPLREIGAWSEPIPITSQVAVPGVRTPPTAVVVHLSAPWPWPIEWWRSDVDHAAAALGGLEGTVVAAGDFNSTTDMAQFRRILDNGYRGADRFAATFPADSTLPPVLAIDHILVRNGSSSVQTADIPGSDHRAVLATVGVPD